MTPRKLFARAFGSVFAVAFLASMSAAQASTVYTYTGPNYLAAHIVDNPAPAGTYTPSMNLTGSFSVASPLLGFSGAFVPDSFSFFDGRNTLTNLDATSSFFSIQTDSSGMILSWTILLNRTPVLGPSTMVGDQSLQLLTIGTTGVLGSGEDEALFLEVTNVVIFPGGGSSISQTGDDARTNVSLGPLLDLPVGTWEETTTPLPAALPLFASGLGGLVLLGWRRKRKAQAAA